MSVWDRLDDEFDAWMAAGRLVNLWWRDDDAIAHTPALARLIALSSAYRVPLALSIVPHSACDALVPAVSRASTLTLVQHGYAHVNHAAAGARAGEFVPARTVAVNVHELKLGWQRMQALFGTQAFPVLVPPWNWIDPTLVPHLAELGYCGLSTTDSRELAMPAPGVVQVNTHLDVIDWRGPRFKGKAKAMRQLVAHLRKRREGRADESEPTGILTHHLAHDAGAWSFIEVLLAKTTVHSTVRWLSARDIFAAPKSDAPSSRRLARRSA